MDNINNIDNFISFLNSMDNTNNLDLDLSNTLWCVKSETPFSCDMIITDDSLIAQDFQNRFGGKVYSIDHSIIVNSIYNKNCDINSDIRNRLHYSQKFKNYYCDVYDGKTESDEYVSSAFFYKENHIHEKVFISTKDFEKHKENLNNLILKAKEFVDLEIIDSYFCEDEFDIDRFILGEKK